MKPFYEKGGIVIYHGDCREVLPTLEKVDLVLTDPPYGIGYDPTYLTVRHKVLIHGDDIEFDPKHLLELNSLNFIIWGANNFANKLPVGGWICWDKRTNEQADKILGSPIELAWCSKKTLFAIHRLQHCGVINHDGAGIQRVHPTQKPIALMAGCLRHFPSESVVDPYMGSGTTLVAAKQLGRKCIGIEIEEKYCEIAALRLAQDLLPFEEVPI